MISSISSNWKTALQEDFNNEVRIYISPRGKEYGPVGTPAYSDVNPGDVSGCYNLTQCDIKYFLPLSLPFTIDVVLKPGYAYDAADKYFCTWSYDTMSAGFFYNATTQRFAFRVYDTYAHDLVFGPTFANDAALQIWQRLTITVDASGTVSAYYNGSAFASSSISFTSLTELPFFYLQGNIAQEYNIVRLFNFEATAAQISNNYKDVLNAETVWFFNKTAHARERCNITQYCNSFNIDEPGHLSAKTASVSVLNLHGQFSSDQYRIPTFLAPADDLYPAYDLYPYDDTGDFIPESGFYNGTVDERFLTRRVPLEIETWYPESSTYFFEPLFYGNILPGGFARDTEIGSISGLTLQATDPIEELALKIARKSYVWESYYLSRVTDAGNSLLHAIAGLGANRIITNYICNSGFENTTIGNSWSGTLTRNTTHVLYGTYSAQLSGSDISQSITKPLSSGETFTFSIWLYSESVKLINLHLADYLGAVPYGSTASSVGHNGNGWQLFQVTHEVVNSNSDRLICSFTTTDFSGVWADCAMLVAGDYKPFFVLNANDGSAGVSDYSQAVDGTYLYIGISGDDVTFIHPWAIVRKGVKVWDKVKELSDASMAKYLLIDNANVLRLVTALTADGTGTDPIENIKSIGAYQYSDWANYVKVEGIYINKKNKVETVWELKAAGLEEDTSNTASGFQRTVGTGQYFPLTTEAAEGLECEYSEDTE